jgi:Nuclease-related domain
MEAKASRNPGAVARRRGGLRDRLAAFVPRVEPGGNGHAAERTEAAPRLKRYLRGSGAVALHHCRVPGKRRGEISHVVVGPAGVTVVDSRHYNGRKAKLEDGKLRVGKRNRTDLIKRVLDQAARVRELLADTHYADVDVEAALAWKKVEGVPIIQYVGGPRLVVCGTRRIAGEASRPGPLSPREVHALASFLAGELSA